MGAGGRERRRLAGRVQRAGPRERSARGRLAATVPGNDGEAGMESERAKVALCPGDRAPACSTQRPANLKNVFVVPCKAVF